jgi:hypothetical protein
VSRLGDAVAPLLLAAWLTSAAGLAGCAPAARKAPAPAPAPLPAPGVPRARVVVQRSAVLDAALFVDELGAPRRDRAGRHRPTAALAAAPAAAPAAPPAGQATRGQARRRGGPRTARPPRRARRQAEPAPQAEARVGAARQRASPARRREPARRAKVRLGRAARRGDPARRAGVRFGMRAGVRLGIAPRREEPTRRARAARWRARVARWRARLRKAPAPVRRAVRTWAGRGRRLAYLLSALRARRLGRLLARLGQPAALRATLTQALDEPAFAPDLRRLLRSRGELEALFSWLQAQGFSALRRDEGRAARARGRRQVQALIGQLHAPDLLRLVEGLTGRPVPQRRLRVVVAGFGRPGCFQLSGFAVAWVGAPAHPGWALAHGLAEKFNPSPTLRRAVRRLAGADAHLARARRRIHREQRALEEEELVDGAATYLAWGLGLERRKRLLRTLRQRHRCRRTGRSGAPLATVIFDELRRARIMHRILSGDRVRFDYDAFLRRLFSGGRLTAGKLAARARRLWRPVAVSAGIDLVLDDRGPVVRALPRGRGAARAGLRPGDRVLRINGRTTAGKPLERLRDYLVGPPGRKMVIIAKRGDDQLRIVFTLGR